MLRAVDDTIILKLKPKGDKLGNIIIPGGGDWIQQTATVMAVGRGRMVPGLGVVPLDVNVGDVVVLAANHPIQKIRDIDGDEYGLASYQAIAAFISYDGNLRDAFAATLAGPPTKANEGRRHLDSEFRWMKPAKLEAGSWIEANGPDDEGARRVLPIGDANAVYQYAGKDFEFVGEST